MEQLEKKETNKSWVAEGKKPREVVRISRFEPKISSLLS